jgi:hypothetical protein
VYGTAMTEVIGLMVFGNVKSTFEENLNGNAAQIPPQSQ